MKCYYEELGIARDASDGDIKTAYRKLALRWHPDKNPDCSEEAKERFQLIQQAYEILSDAQERAWYDNHRDQILRGKNSEYEDNSLDLFPYFTSLCFKGYGDDANGFYSVYRKLFEDIIAEESDFFDDDTEITEIPTFGNSTSSYEEVVAPFYAYWQAFCTKKTYSWLCPYDIQEIRDRRILRTIEKEMKKVVQKSKKERNDEVRNLVSFIRKRDKRVQAYKLVLEQRAEVNRQKIEQNRIERLKKRQQELKELRENRKPDAFSESYEARLKELLQQYDSNTDEEDESEEEYRSEAGEDVAEEEEKEEEENYLDELYCIACNKAFKNTNAFANHETSKKHRESVGRLKKEMQNEEEAHKQQLEKDLVTSDLNVQANGHTSEEIEEVDIIIQPESSNGSVKKNRKSKKTKKIQQLPKLDNTDCTDVEDTINDLLHKSKLIDGSDDDADNDVDWNSSAKKSTKKNKTKKQMKKPTEVATAKTTTVTKPDATATPVSNEAAAAPNVTAHICATCNSTFQSKNKLFTHLKQTNHSIFIPKPKPEPEPSNGKKKTKGKQK